MNETWQPMATAPKNPNPHDRNGPEILLLLSPRKVVIGYWDSSDEEPGPHWHYTDFRWPLREYMTSQPPQAWCPIPYPTKEELLIIAEWHT